MSSSPADAERVFQSDTATVFRLAAGTLCKQPLGRGAAERVRHEKQILARLAGIAGVSRMIPAQAGDGLALEDGGESLARLLARGRIELAGVLRIACTLASALAAVHARGVLHGDITPGNIVCGPAPDHATTLIDFDLSSVVGGEGPPPPAAGGRVGTLAYMAPEQTGRTGWSTDHRADLYALGVVLYEMAVGRLPFTAPDALALTHAHLTQLPLAPASADPSLPQPLSDIILRLLEKEPARRYQGAEGLMHDLARVRDAVARGEACVFTVGEQDFGARLEPPARPIGRSAELAAMRAVVGSSVEEMDPCVLVAGPAGAGKTTLVNELRSLVAQREGWLVSASFHEHRRDPFASAAALRGLGRLLLAEPEEYLVECRQRMLKAVGRNLGLGPTQLPEFQLLLGKHEAPPVANPREAEARINQTALALLRSVASPQRPVVMVLEDLQWAPSIALAFLHAVVTAPERTPGFLVVGTYRAESLAEGEPLHALFTHWRAAGVMPAQLELANLSLASTRQMVAEMLREPPEQIRALAQALYERTAGNPHDIVELLNALRQEGLLRRQDGAWAWSAADVRAYVGECSVHSLLTRRVARLPQASARLMQAIALLGGAVRQNILEAALGVDSTLVERGAAPAAEDGLLVMEKGPPALLRFRHARVQEAALDGMDAAARVQMHLAFARRLLQCPEMEGIAAEQYLAGAAAIQDDEEAMLCAGLFRRAAGAVGALNFSVARRYMEAELGLLARLQSPPPEALLQVEIALHQVLYGMGSLAEADALYACVAARCQDPMQLAAPTRVQIYSLANRSRYQEALDLALALLARLGLARPDDYRRALTRGVENVAKWCASDARQSDFERPLVTEPRVLALGGLLNTAQTAAYFCDAATFGWLALEAHRSWIEHGPCEQLLAGACAAVTLLVGQPQDYRGAYAGTRHLLAVGEARSLATGAAAAEFTFALSVGHWLDPVETVIECFRRSREELLRAGDFRMASYTYLATDLLFDSAPTLVDAAAEVESGLAFAARVGNADYTQRYLPRRQLLRALSGQTAAAGSFGDASFDEASYTQNLVETGTAAATYHMARALCAAIFGNGADWGRHAEAAVRLQARTPGYYLMAVVRVLHAVARATQARLVPRAERDAMIGELDANHLAWLRARAADAPANYLHLLRWVEAERAWTMDGLWQAGAAFDAALEEVASHQRPWHAALITERAAMFHLAHGLEASGRRLLATARDRYEAWGAHGKVREMERCHAVLRTGAARAGAGAGAVASADQVDAEAIDLMGVIRASQSLSAETNLSRLRARVTELLGAMTGATHVVVLLCNNDAGGWMLPGDSEQGDESGIALSDASAQGMLPMTAVRYAQRTGEALVVADACRDERFADDPYLAPLERCSLLVVPIFGHGVQRAMLLLENRFSAGAFSAERLDAVTLIAGQLAVSLENAQLYGELELRVQERTRQLRSAQAELVDTARRAGMAEIATNVLHNVGNVLNSVNVSVNLMTSQLRTSRLTGLARAVELLYAHENDLGDFVTNDEKGRMLPGYLASLSETLADEQRLLTGELAGLTRSVEHIKEVVATQQSHAGNSALMERTDVASLVDDALRINSTLLQRHRIDVIRSMATVPPAIVDRTRVLQILVNLIRNAAQAMQGTQDTRTLTVTLESSADVLTMQVGDTGTGIGAENLTRIFAHGFTTREGGHGFGLHSCALAAREMGGTLFASSDGTGSGATFTLELPLAAAEGPAAGQGAKPSASARHRALP